MDTMCGKKICPGMFGLKSPVFKVYYHDLSSLNTQDTYLPSSHLYPSVRCQLYHLGKFRASVPLKKFYDLSANVDKRCRTDLKNGAMPCLTTSSQLWFHGYILLMINCVFTLRMSRVKKYTHFIIEPAEV